ncbi:multidrug effflux MFS transporter [Algiphilus sp.]|uniref:multidrug effflux MFS transporter n=1 Tax=Algiphilus sp. TaxID=1872431 RepID=UPI003B518D9A
MNDAPAPIPRGLVLLLGSIMAFGPLSIDMYLPSLPTLGEVFGATEARVQLTLSAYLLGLAVGQLIYGPVADRWGRRRPLLFGIALFTIASIGCALATSIDALIALRALQALGGAAGMVMVRAVVRDLFSAQGGARMYSMLMLVMGAAPILAPALGGQVLIWMGWRWIFGALALMGLICFTAVALHLAETLPEGVMRTNRARPVSRVAGDYRRVLTHPQFFFCVLTGASSLAALFAYISASPFVLIDLLGVEPAAYGVWFGLNAAAFIVGSQVNARLLRHRRPEQILPWTVGAFAVATLVMLAVCASPAFGLFSFLCSMAVVLFTVGCTLANTTALALQPFVYEAGAASALLGTMQLSAGAAAGIAVAISYSDSPIPLAVVVAACGIIAFAAFARGQRYLVAELA